MTALVGRITAEHPQDPGPALRAAGMLCTGDVDADTDVALALGGWSLRGALDLLGLDPAVVPGPPVLAAALCGAGQRCVALGTGYARRREAFGRPLSLQPVQRQAFAGVATAVAAAFALTRRAAAAWGTAAERAACVPVAADAAWGAAEAALQVHGGNGYSTDYPVAAVWSQVAAVRAALDRPSYDHLLALAPGTS